VDLFVRGSSLTVAPLAGDRRRQVERNLRRVHGERLGPIAERRAVARTFESYARYWAESFRLPGTSPEALDAGLTVDGWDRIEAARAEGNGVILALPHLGGWEWAGMWVTRCRGVPLTAVVESLEPPDVYEWFVALREQCGVHVIALGPKAGPAVLRALADNHVVCLLCDRDIAGGGVPVEFFGEMTTLPGGPALLSLRSGAPVLPTAVYYEGSRRRAVIRPALDTARRGKLRDDVARITKDLATELEVLIRRAPEQWHLLQPNWPSDRGET
jgi:KDO2-lipid IV(A) lauroyltransferase